MKIVKDGDKVQLLCEGKLEDGRIFYKNEQQNPLIFIVGKGEFFPVVENELINMTEGETKTVPLEPKDAFGVHNKDLVAEIPKNEIQTDNNLDIGCKIQMKTSNDKIIQGMITEIKDEAIIVDFNHPLVDKKVFFTITIMSIDGN